MPDSDSHHHVRSPRSRSWFALGLLGWTLTLALGFKLITAYELRPGTAGAAPATWPADAGIARDSQKMNLIVFVHPQCPCTRATVAELAQVLTACRDQVATQVLVYAPAEQMTAWNESSLAQSIRALPGVRTLPDRDGRLAARFGAETSGQVLLFDRSGRLQFSGGITGARGHEGDNAGYRAVVARIAGQQTGLAHTAVFGCAIRDEPPAPEGRL